MTLLEQLLADYVGVDNHWTLQAACRGMDPDLFFSDTHMGVTDGRYAKQVCAGCPVRGECLNAGVDEVYGVWGGYSPRERQQMRRTRRTSA